MKIQLLIGLLLMANITFAQFDVPQKGGEGGGGGDILIGAPFFKIIRNIQRLVGQYDFNSLENNLVILRIERNLKCQGRLSDACSYKKGGVPITEVNLETWLQMPCNSRFHLVLHELFVHKQIETSFDYSVSQPIVDDLVEKNRISCDILASYNNFTQSFAGLSSSVSLKSGVKLISIPGITYDSELIIDNFSKNKTIDEKIEFSISREAMIDYLAKAGLPTIDKVKTVYFQIYNSAYNYAHSTAFHSIVFNIDNPNLEIPNVIKTYAEMGKIIAHKNLESKVKIAAPTSPNDLEIPSATESEISVENFTTSLELLPSSISKITVVNSPAPDMTLKLKNACQIDWDFPAYKKSALDYICKRNNPEVMKERYNVKYYFTDHNGQKRYLTYQNVPAYLNFDCYFLGNTIAENCDKGKNYNIYIGFEPGPNQQQWDEWIYGNYPKSLIDYSLNRRSNRAFILDLKLTLPIGYEGDTNDRDLANTRITAPIHSNYWKPQI